ncbi:MAG TPA: RHS repeat-associated core domain-containing protein [Nitrolancea sp.]|nr:RHS repeat-associated core domain-containing protein [Nitrolancea sp.]
MAKTSTLKSAVMPVAAIQHASDDSLPLASPYRPPTAGDTAVDDQSVRASAGKALRTFETHSAGQQTLSDVDSESRAHPNDDPTGVSVDFRGSTFQAFDGACGCTVYSGIPLFQGTIVVLFTNPSTDQPVIVHSFTAEIGYIDNPGSVAITAYGPTGVVARLSANSVGFNNLTATGSIIGFTIGETSFEGAGFALDNLTFPTTGEADPLNSTALNMSPGESEGLCNGAEPNCAGSQGYGADPVNVETGNLTQSFNDISVGGDGPGLSLERSYNSLAHADGGLFGNGWSSIFDMNVATDPTSGDVTVTQANGAQVTYASSDGVFSAAPRVNATLTQAPSGGYTFVTGRGLTYRFDASGALLAVSDRNGYTDTVSRPSDHVIVMTDHAGRTIALSLSDGLVASATDPMGRTTHYTYNAAGDLESVTDPVGASTTFGYDSNDLLTSWTDPRGHITAWTYDPQERVTSETDRAGLVTSFNYTEFGDATVETDPQGNTVTDVFAGTQLVQRIDDLNTPDQRVWNYLYDPFTNGQIEAVNPAGYVSTASYDAAGNPVVVVDRNGNGLTYTYNDLNEITSVKTPRASLLASPYLTTYSYDGDGNLESVTDGLGNTTRYTYGDAAHPGDPTATTDPAGRHIEYGYDSDGDIASITRHPSTAESDTTSIDHDADGEAVCVISAMANASGAQCPRSGGAPSLGVSTTSYDADGRPLSVVSVSGVTTTDSYDADGNVATQTDGNGDVTTTSYDGDNRKLTVTAGSGSGASSETSFAYDLAAGTSVCTGVNDLSYCTTTTSPDGGTTVDLFNPLNQLVSVNRSGSATTNTYDVAGDESSSTDNAGRMTTYGYDPGDRLVSVGYADGSTPSVAYSYDADGDRLSMTDGTGVTNYTYDRDDRLTSQTNAAGLGMGYGYDSSGDVTTLTYPNGRVVNRAYDGEGQLSTVTDWQGQSSSFDYNANGQLSKLRYPNGVTESEAYNAGGQLTGIADKSSTATFSAYSYGYDGNANITSMTASGSNPGPGESYAYDSQNRLTTYTTGSSSGLYGYDADGNLTGLADGTALTYNDQDELTGSQAPSGATTSYGYNANGDLTTITPSVGQAQSLTYDLADRLSSYSSGTTSAAYTYNGDGQRAGKLVGSSSYEYFYDEVTGAAPVLTSDGTTSYVYGPNDLLIEQLTNASASAITRVATGTAASTLGLGNAPSLTVNFSAPAQAGDQILLLVNQSSTESSSAPAGYVNVGGFKPANAGETLSVWRKTATGGESSATVGFSGSSLYSRTIIALVYRGVDPTNPIDQLGSAGTGLLKTSVTTPSLTTTVDGDELVLAEDALTNLPGTTWKPPSGMTTESSASTLVVSAAVADQSLGNAGSTGTRTATTNLPATLEAVAIALRRAPSADFIGHDAQGSTRLLFDQGGAVRGTYAYSPYGVVTSHTGPDTCSLRYNGQYQDDESGLYYLSYRYYDAAIGQFISPDPMVSVSFATYSYAGGNPLRFADPLGLDKTTIENGLQTAAATVSLAAAVCDVGAVFSLGGGLLCGLPLGAIATVLTELDAAVTCFHDVVSASCGTAVGIFAANLLTLGLASAVADAPPWLFSSAQFALDLVGGIQGIEDSFKSAGSLVTLIGGAGDSHLDTQALQAIGVYALGGCIAT